MPSFNLMSYIMPREDETFFKIFQNSSEICIESAKLYNEILNKGFSEELKNAALDLKKKSSISYRLTLKHLNNSFMTPIEREDIQYIAVQLRKISKKIIKACSNIEVYNLVEYTDAMKEQALILIQATEKLAIILKEFKKVSDVEEMSRKNIEMKKLETQGDGVVRNAMADLFSGRYEALEVIKVRDMYEHIEKALDACFYVSDTILNVVLKQS